MKMNGWVVTNYKKERTMKNHRTVNASIILLLMSFLITAYDQGYEPLSNAVYFGEAQTSVSKKVTVKEDGATANVYLSLAAPTENDVEVVLSNDEQVLEAFNKRNGTNYQLLPSSYYSLSSTQCKVEAGKISSELVDINISTFDDGLEAADKYAIPVKIASATGVDILGASDHMVILCDKVINTKVLFTPGGATGASPTYTHVVQSGDTLSDNMLVWTVEFLVYCESFVQNGHVLRFNDESGTATLFSRFGQFDHPVDEFQITLFNIPIFGVNLYEPKRWYHIAFTCDGSTLRLYQDGVLDLTIDHPEPNTTLSWREFRFATGNAGAISEARIWNTVRTRAEIESNMYAVNPQTEGLISYWKLDEGVGTAVGTTFKDYTGNGRTLKLNKSGATWKDQSFPPEY